LGLRGSSRRGSRCRDLDEEESLVLLLCESCVSVCRPAVPKKLVDGIVLSSWVTGGIPVSPTGSGDNLSTVERLASFLGEVLIAGVNSAGTGISIFVVDGRRATR